MPTSKDMRQIAAMRSTTGKEREASLGVPDTPLASDPHEGLRRGRARAALYAENLADGAAEVAFGEETKSRHTRVQAMQILSNLMQEVPDRTPILKAKGDDQN